MQAQAEAEIFDDDSVTTVLLYQQAQKLPFPTTQDDGFGAQPTLTIFPRESSPAP